VLNPFERIGTQDKGGIDGIKNHPFFKGVDFSQPKLLSVSDAQIAYI
jgi:hypothetical protein